MIKYLIYFTNKENTENYFTYIFAKDEESVRYKFKIKFPYDVLMDVVLLHESINSLSFII